MIFILIEFNISNWISEIVTKLFMIGFVIWCSSTHPFISTQFPPPTSPVSLLPPLCCLYDRHFSPLCLSVPPSFWELWFAIQIVKGYQISSFTYYQHSVPEQSDHFQLLSYCFLLYPNCHTHFQTLTNPPGLFLLALDVRFILFFMSHRWMQSFHMSLSFRLISFSMIASVCASIY